MIFYLLLPALTLGVLASQPANTTEELDEVLRDQTFRVMTENRTAKPKNATSLSYTEEIELQDELNKTSTFLTEDDESFQDQDTNVPEKGCDLDLLIKYSYSYCGKNFQEEMQKINAEDWCVLENVIRPYNDLTLCLEGVTGLVNCFFPNPEIQDVFLHIHSYYFHNCTEKEELLLDETPTSLLVALTIIPVSLIPILVYLVGWKS
ncbi:receptor activity-modifying protein 3 [Nothobranchius furzeri]|uniref:Receptor activity-modifying protein 3-like n=1 Tax=Nothobranchius furzeri TaxID=105023 RepID=A0A8C6Q2L7_NOTFU|nr:receptor activity-modifying protein 3 [Nothobranchius furzeri]KAF7203753.1 receptor activity-modifying protein 3-like [Nothobranchius furzeri]